MKAFLAVAGIVKVLPPAIANTVQIYARQECAQLELKAAVERMQPMLTPEGFVKLEELARVAAQFGDTQGFLNAVSTVIGAQFVCQCWWCKLKRGARSHIGKLAISVGYNG